MGKRKWWIVAAIAWMVSIFFATQLPYFTGQNTAKVIRKAFINETKTIGVQSDSTVDINELNLIVRKVTHIIVFGILAFLLFKSLETLRFSYMFACLLTVLYVLSDEWHQSFMPGRVAAYWDVLFDSVGAMIALLISYLIISRKIEKTGS
ncbi:VanZ family protein [Neobacillus niacini]|uniref:VanZ family protein n=1 Tax=Neobacillus niacini TaxID=86668 RepID=UPI002FFDA2C9